MRLWSLTQAPFSLAQKTLPQTIRQVAKKSGPAPMKSILSVAASQVMSLMIGCKPKPNSSVRRRQRQTDFRSRVRPNETSTADYSREVGLSNAIPGLLLDHGDRKSVV